jgi:hypothetical protein
LLLPTLLSILLFRTSFVFTRNHAVFHFSGVKIELQIVLTQVLQIDTREQLVDFAVDEFLRDTANKHEIARGHFDYVHLHKWNGFKDSKKKSSSISADYENKGGDYANHKFIPKGCYFSCWRIFGKLGSHVINVRHHLNGQHVKETINDASRRS